MFSKIIWEICRTVVNHRWTSHNEASTPGTSLPDRASIAPRSRESVPAIEYIERQSAWSQVFVRENPFSNSFQTASSLEAIAIAFTNMQPFSRANNFLGEKLVWLTATPPPLLHSPQCAKGEALANGNNFDILLDRFCSIADMMHNMGNSLKPSTAQRHLTGWNTFAFRKASKLPTTSKRTWSLCCST